MLRSLESDTGLLLTMHRSINFKCRGITNSSNVTSTYGGYGAADSGKISFSDTAESNSDQQIPLSELKLLNTDLEDVTLSDLQGDQNLLLVVIRGVPLCPFCTAQTSRLVNNYKKKFGSWAAKLLSYFLVRKTNSNNCWPQRNWKINSCPSRFLLTLN